MKVLIAYALSGLLLGASLIFAGEDMRREQVRFEEGTSGTTITGEIRGYQGVDYQVPARAGQTVVVNFKPSNPSAYFNILPPVSDAALFVGSSSGNQFAAEAPADGIYTIRVYLMRNAARRNEMTRYTLKVSVADGITPAAASGKIGRASCRERV